MAATSKAELLQITEKEFGKLEKLLVSVDEKTALMKRDEETSIKDVVSHRAHWIDLFQGWYADGVAGKTVYFPAEGYKWNDLKRYNADLRSKQVDLGWAEALLMLRDRYGNLISFIEGHSDTDLYSEPMKGANNRWPPGRWAEAAGPSHFRSAAKYIRSVLKKQQS